MGSYPRRFEQVAAHRFQFRGSGNEYFGVWIANVIRTILTAGVYSPWATVRRRRYFLNATYFDGHNFEYHAEGFPILAGRLAVIAAFLVYFAVVGLAPVFLYAGVLLLLLVPWIVNTALAFNAENTSYRSVRFTFAGDYMGALVAYVAMPILAIVTLGLLAPVASRVQRGYIADNLRWGRGSFRYTGGVMPLFGALARTVLFAIVCGTITWFLSRYLAPKIIPLIDVDFIIRNPAMATYNKRLLLEYWLGNILFAGPLVLLTAGFYRTAIRNVTWPRIAYEDANTLGSAVPLWDYALITASNLIITVVTLGLFRPWAVARSWALFATSTTFVTDAMLDLLAESAKVPGNAARVQEPEDQLSFGF
ncbi:MAG: YjgN family protein [Hyphomicrobiales bacterium]